MAVHPHHWIFKIQAYYELESADRPALAHTLFYMERQTVSKEEILDHMYRLLDSVCGFRMTGAVIAYASGIPVISMTV